MFSNLFERRPLKTAASSLMLSLVVALTAAKTPRLMAEPILVPASAQVVARNVMPSPRDKAASAVPSATTSASVACTNTASDIGLLQAAVNGGGTVTVSGNCSVSGGSVNINNPVSITGSATIIANPAATNFTFFINVDNVSINGLTFVAAGIRLTGANTSARTNVNLTNNTFRDFGMNPIGQAMNAAVWVDPIWRNSKFTGNTLKNLWYGGFSNTNAANVCSLGGSTLCDNTHESMYFFGVFFFGGLDNTQIEFNTFSQISGNGVKGFNNGLSAMPGGYQAAGTSVSYNTFTYIHRIGIEIQNCNSPGTTCNGFGNIYLTPKFAGNYFHSPAWGFIDTYAFSLPVIGTGSQFINNAAIGDFSGNATHTVARLGYAFEEPPGTGCCGTNVWDGSAIEQGNLVASDINSSDSSNAGWYAGFVNYGSAAAQTHQYNVMCGPNWNETVTNAPSLNEVDQYNYKSASCPSGSGAALFASSITAQTGTPTTAGSVETFPLAVISGLPIRNVQFSVDGISASIQEIADGNTNFQNDRKWLYHATVNVASMASGSHTLSAVVTDVSGTAQPYTQSFALGTTVVGKTASSSGTTIPSATQIVDASGIVWTVASGFSYENGTADGGSNITLLLYFNGGVYADSTAYGWWSHAKGIWQSIAGDPRPASVSASASGTTIPSATQIIDASGIVWTVASGLSYQNGIADGGVDITLLLYFNGSVYADTPAYGWWSHAKGSWQAVSGDPRPANSSGSASGTTIPSAKQIIDASGIVWTVASGSSYENGTADGGADIILLLYFNGSMYADTSLYGWWSHAKGSWQAVSGDPRPAGSSASAGGTTIPSATQIIDASGIVWTLASGFSYENGTADGGANIILLLYFNGSIYANTTVYGWWSHANGSWQSVSGDPRPAAITPLAPGTYTFVDPNGNALDLGWALNPSWGEGLSVRTYAVDATNIYQQLMFTAAGQLQSAATQTEYLSNSSAVLTVGGTAGIFGITQSGSGYIIKDHASGLYVTTSASSQSVTLSATQTVWTPIAQ